MTEGKQVEPPEIVGLSDASVDTKRVVFMLMALLPKLGRPDLLPTIRVDAQGEDEFGVFVSGVGVGVDVGVEVPVESVLGGIKRPGYRVYTMETQGGGRWHPPEDVDVTRIETHSAGDAMQCVGELIVEEAVRALPDFPPELAYDDPVLEPAW